MSAATDADYSQRVYSIYPENDRVSPRRNANSFEHRIMDSLCEQVRRFFEVPEVVRLVAIFLQHCDHHDMEIVDTEVSTEDLKFAKECLHGLPPQVDLVEGLTAEAQAVGSVEAGPGAPARIELRAERFYMFCTLGAALGTADVRYKIGFIWMVLVLCREVLDLGQAFELAGDKAPASTPVPTTAARSVRTQPKGKAGHWLEGQLTDGGCFKPAELPMSNQTLRHAEVEVPTHLKLKEVHCILAKKEVPTRYMCWALESWISNTHLLGGFVDAQTTEAMEDVLVKLRHHICITAPYHVREGHVDERDVFDAREADYLPAIVGYLYWQTLLPPD